jgi:hypothetical protein
MKAGHGKQTTGQECDLPFHDRNQAPARPSAKDFANFQKKPAALHHRL